MSDMTVGQEPRRALATALWTLPRRTSVLRSRTLQASRARCLSSLSPSDSARRSPAPSCGPLRRVSSRFNARALRLAKEFLDAEWRVVSSSEVEQLTGLSRYTLARQFRVAFA